MMGYTNITVNVTPYVQPLIPLDPSRVCLLLQGDANVPVFAVNSYDYSAQCDAAIFEAADLVAAKLACEQFFSVSSGKKDAVFAVYKDDLTVLDTTDENQMFGFCVLIGLRESWADFDLILAKTSGSSQFLVTNEDSGVAPTAPVGIDFLIQISNPTQIALEVISFLAARLSANPAADCSTTISGSAIQGSNYSLGIYNQLVAAGCNFYTMVDGLMSLESGIVNSKKKIERAYFSGAFLPYFLRVNIAEFKASQVIREDDTVLVYNFFTNLFMSLYSQRYLKKSPILDDNPFLIDNIFVQTDPQSGVKEMVVQGRYSFNNNIDKFSIGIGEVA